jgi:hypothetical protein
MRHIISGRTLSRPLVDCQGRSLASMDHFTTRGIEHMIVAQVPPTGVPTIYARIGYVFSWSCVAELLALVGAASTRRLRGTAPAASPK